MVGTYWVFTGCVLEYNRVCAACQEVFCGFLIFFNLSNPKPTDGVAGLAMFFRQFLGRRKAAVSAAGCPRPATAMARDKLPPRGA